MFTKAQTGACWLLIWLLLIAMMFSYICGENITSKSCSERSGFWCEDDSDCIPNRYVCSGIVECQDKSDESLKNCVFLAGQHGHNYGRVDVIYNGVIGTVCSNGWNRKDARVICRQLGLETAYAHTVRNGLLGHGSGPIWIDRVQCNGTEEHLGLCRFAGYGNHQCYHNWDVGVLCQGTKVSLFLGGTHGTNFGRLQAMHAYNNSVGTVCDDGWDDDDAKVACRQLGHPTTHARAVHNAKFEAGTGPIWLSNVDCQGTESNIISCGKHSLEWNNCSHNEDAGVICGYDLDVRLDNNAFRNPAEGELHVKFKSNWIAVPYTSYSGTAETEVICRQLGFSPQYGKKFRIPVNSGGPKLKHSQVLSKLKCDGTERNIGHCRFTVENTPQMSRYEHIVTTYIVCGGGKWNGYPTFINVTAGNEIITVPVNHQVDFVCETLYSLPQRRLQWQTSSQILNKAIITTSTELLTNMAYVTKSRITFNVSHTDNGTSLECASEHILDSKKTISKKGILHIEGTKVSLFLGGTHGTNFGRLQAMHAYNNSVGTVCDDGWDDDDAKVACRQLGHPTKHAKAVHSATFEAGTGPFWLSNVDCQGTESNIFKCGILNLGRNNCSHNEDAGVICGYDLDVRLDNNAFRSPAEGELQVKYKSNWMTVPYTSYSGTAETEVICRQLGFSPHYGKKFRSPVYPDGPRMRHYQVLSKLECDGTEENVGYCRFTVENTQQMSKYEHIVSTYIVCGGGTWNGYPTFINVTAGNEIITVPVNHQVDFVCETSYSLPQRRLQWQTSSRILNKAIITTSTELLTNMAYVTKSRITFNVSQTDNGTTLRCTSENLLDNIYSKASSKTGVLRIADIETTVLSPSTSPDTVDISTFTAATSVLGVLAVLLGIGMTYFVINHVRHRRSKGFYDSPVQTMEDSGSVHGYKATTHTPEQTMEDCGSVHGYKTTTFMTASCPDNDTDNTHLHDDRMTNPSEHTYDVPPFPREVHICSDKAEEHMYSNVVSKRNDRTGNRRAQNRKIRETVEIDEHGYPKLKK